MAWNPITLKSIFDGRFEVKSIFFDKHSSIEWSKMEYNRSIVTKSIYNK